MIQGLLEQLEHGFAQGLLVCNAEDAEEGAAATLAKLASVACPGASLIRAARLPRGAALAALASLLGLIADSPAAATLPFDSLTQREARASMRPGWRLPPSVPLTRNPALGARTVVVLPTPPAVLLEPLLALLKAQMTPPTKPKLLLVTGAVATPVGLFTIDLAPCTDRLPRDASPPATSLLCVCDGISAPELCSLILSCRPLLELSTLLTPATLPVHEVEALRKKALHDFPLPDGVFHDGTAFLSLDGTRSADHPQLPALLQAHLAERNAAAAVHNAQVRWDSAVG